MPPLPLPPDPRPASHTTRLPFASADPGRALAFEVPRYFIEVKVPGYSVEKTVARIRRIRQQQPQAQPGESGKADPTVASMRESMPDV